MITPEEIGKWSDGVRRGSEEDLRRAQGQDGHAGEARGLADRLPHARRKPLPHATASRRELSFEDVAKERGLSPADYELGLIAKSAIIDPATADAAFALASGEVSQPVQGRFGVALVKVGKIEAGSVPTYESVAAIIKKEIATANARAKVNELQGKMEDERGGGASIAEAAQKLGLTAVTIDAVDRSGRMPNGQLVANIPRGLDVVSQAFNSDVGIDNDPIQFQGGYVWYDVLGITPSRERNLDEVRDQLESRWREDQISSRLRTKAAEMVKKLELGGNLADEAAAIGAKVESAKDFKREGSPAGVPSSAVTAAFRTAKDGVGQSGSGAEWVVFRVTDINVPQVDAASDDVKKLRDTLQRSSDRRAGRAIRHQDRIRDRHQHQSGRLRAGDGRCSSN